mgnify:FL=1
MTREEQRKVAMTRLNYPPGTRLELISMGKDPDPVHPGTRGTVERVNSYGDIEMSWDNGRTLSLIPGEDSFRKLTMEELEAEQELAAEQESGGMQWQTL